MDINEIKNIIDNHKEEILSKVSREERLDSVINIINDSFPKLSVAEAMCGSLENLSAPAKHIEAQLIISALQKMQSANSKFVVKGFNGGQDLADIVLYIQKFVEYNVI